jgi:hypothetical protein
LPTNVVSHTSRSSLGSRPEPQQWTWRPWPRPLGSTPPAVAASRSGAGPVTAKRLPCGFDCRIVVPTAWSCPGSVDGDGLAGQAAARCFFS